MVFCYDGVEAEAIGAGVSGDQKHGISSGFTAAAGWPMLAEGRTPNSRQPKQWGGLGVVERLRTRPETALLEPAMNRCGDPQLLTRTRRFGRCPQPWARSWYRGTGLRTILRPALDDVSWPDRPGRGSKKSHDRESRAT